MSHPPLPKVRARVKVGVSFIFKFMGGVGGWVVSRKCPTHPSLRLGLEPRLGLGLSLSLWDGWVAISRKCPTHPS